MAESDAVGPHNIILSGGIPILRIFSLGKALEFYVRFLGFTVDWEHRFEADFPIYLQVSRNTLRLHLSEHHGDASPGSNVFVFVPMEGIAAYRDELIGRGYKFARPGIQDAPWGRVLEVADPVGNRIRFCEQRH